MMLRLAALFGLLGASASAAPSCSLNGAPAIDLHERAKAAFLSGDYEGFTDQMPGLFADEAAAKAIHYKLRTVFPHGFTACSSIMHRADTGGMVQEVTLFEVPDTDYGVMALLLTSSLDAAGSRRLIYMIFDSSISTVLEEIR